MASRQAPNRYAFADARRLVLQSRGFMALMFGLFLFVGVVLIAHGGPIPLSLGTSLIASALVSLTTLWIDNLRSGEEARSAALIEAGLAAVQPKRDLPEYREMIRAARRIDVTGYTLKSFAEENHGLLRDKAAAGSPAEVRVILVDPACAAASAMAAAEGLTNGNYSAIQASTLSRIAGIERVSVRYLAQHLSMMIYRIDDVLYTGPYPISAESRTAFTLRIERGWMFDQGEKEFEALWNKALPRHPEGV